MKHAFPLAVLGAIAVSSPAVAAPGAPVTIADGLTLDPILESRVRYEGVETPSLDADAVTVRLRAGAEVQHRSGLSLLAEAEGSLAVVDQYNAFPFAIASGQRRTAYATIPDPMTVELNRAQVQYHSKPLTITLGRQRINLDDQRFVGSIGWRQNEQTFDAVRAEAKLGPVNFDGTYAIGQRTIFGVDAGPRQSYEGDFVFVGAGAKLGPLQAKAFAYLLDYDPAEQVGALALPNADTQTYGARLTGTFKMGGATKLSVLATAAQQRDWRDNPANYSVTYLGAEGTLADSRFGVTAGYERLGGNGTRAFQTPMATLHKFNGWADMFLVTPASGLEDIYGGASLKFPEVKALPGLAAGVTWHRFESAQRSLHYGNEWDASVGFKRGPVSVLAKYADYQAAGFGVDTRKMWLQLEVAY